MHLSSASYDALAACVLGIDTACHHGIQDFLTGAALSEVDLSLTFATLLRPHLDDRATPPCRGYLRRWRSKSVLHIRLFFVQRKH
jgi:hypothetical protein